MPVNLSVPETIYPVAGIRLAAAYCGIRKQRRDDLVLIEIAADSAVAVAFTDNAFAAAPVQVAKRHFQQCLPRYLLINAGNANAGTGQRGIDSAVTHCAAVASQCGVRTEEVLPFSTGVIGEYLPQSVVEQALPNLSESLHAGNWLAAASAIMTTDILPKVSSQQIELTTGDIITVTGMTKGAGMIRPNMATMLAYIATDAYLERSQLEALMQECIAQSFNSITVDGDTSTNDACVFIATGKAGSPVRLNSEDYQRVAAALLQVSQMLAQAIVRDAEGASKFVAIEVKQGRDIAECRQVAYAIAHSPLVKTALFASDANWGRILAAVGAAGIDAIDIERVCLRLNDVQIVTRGERDPAYTEDQGAAVMSQDEIKIEVTLARGQASQTIWTCDLSYDYVRINAEYRS